MFIKNILIFVLIDFHINVNSMIFVRLNGLITVPLVIQLVSGLSIESFYYDSKQKIEGCE